MATQHYSNVTLTRWNNSKHPTSSNITRLMQGEGLRPYRSEFSPNKRHPVRTHGYDTVLYMVDGQVEITLPDINQRIKLRAGDRIHIPAHTRHGSVAGQRGAVLLEAALRKKK
jgi:quercetin dioxygenase-like cupin family protein